MIRIARYKDSINRFIKDKSNLFENKSNIKISNLIYEKVKTNDKLQSILFLTIMNNQNKKKKISIQGYHIAVMIEYLNILSNLIKNKQREIATHGVLTYNQTINYLLITSHKLLYENYMSIDTKLTGKNILSKMLKIFNEIVSHDRLFTPHNFILNKKKPKSDTIKWYFQNNNNIKRAFMNLNQINIKSYEKYVNSKVLKLSELAMMLSWHIGNSDIKHIPQIKKAAKYFSTIYRLSNDFNTIEEDIICGSTSPKRFTTNYVVNYGLQKSYEDFMDNKQKFLESLMLLDIYTNTTRELIYHIENKVESIIDQTSPDLKSNYSSTFSVHA